jgi:hypothetical protein
MTEATYRHEFTAAQVNAAQLYELVMRPEPPTIRELATAIGLATMAHESLMRAVTARAHIEQNTPRQPEERNST